MVNLIFDFFNDDVSNDTYGIRSVLFFLESDTDECFEVAVDIVRSYFKDSILVLKAIGLPESIDEIMVDIESDDAYYDKGDADKFFIKNYPEYVAVISDGQVSELLFNHWSNAIYEKRQLFISNKRNVDNLINRLSKSTDCGRCFADEQWEYIDAAVENVPEFGHHNAFVFTCKANLWNSVWPEIEKKFINTSL